MIRARFPRSPADSMTKAVKSLLLAGALMCPTLGWSAVECNVTPLKAYVDSGTVWITWVGGGATYAPMSDAAAKLYYAAVLTALTTGRGMVVRVADGTSCSAIPATGIALVGLWIV